MSLGDYNDVVQVHCDAWETSNDEIQKSLEKGWRGAEALWGAEVRVVALAWDSKSRGLMGIDQFLAHVAGAEIADAEDLGLGNLIQEAVEGAERVGAGLDFCVEHAVVVNYAEVGRRGPLWVCLGLAHQHEGAAEGAGGGTDYIGL